MFQTLDSVLDDYFPPPVEVAASQNLFSQLSDSSDISDDDTYFEAAQKNQRCKVQAEKYLQDSQDHAEDCDEEENDRPLSQSTPDILMTELRACFRTGCGCKSMCLKEIDIDNVYGDILNLRELAKHEKELLIMGKLFPRSTSENTRSGKRKKVRYLYKHKDKDICKGAFLVLNDMGKKQLENILLHISKHGITPRIHGATGIPKPWGLKLVDTENVIRFIKSYATENGLPQPAAPRASANEPPILLPSAESKVSLYRLYNQACSQSSDSVRCVGLSSFKDIWLKCCPHIKFISPRDDVCSKCELLRKQISDSVSENDKLEFSEKLAQHIHQCKEERTFYNKCVELSRREFSENVSGENMQHLHITFDFALHVTLPHHTRMMGPLYFLSLKKIQIFGVCYEGARKQYNYLISEEETIGPNGTLTHGPNAVISMLHHCIETRNLGEKVLTLHADNCPGNIIVI